jgi:hypothetical protein
MARRISSQSSKHDDYRGEYPQEEEEHKEEFRPPSPAPSYTEKDVLSSMLRRLGELEGRVQVLETKPSEMPFEKVRACSVRSNLLLSVFDLGWCKLELPASRIHGKILL